MRNLDRLLKSHSEDRRLLLQEIEKLSHELATLKAASSAKTAAHTAATTQMQSPVQQTALNNAQLGQPTPAQANQQATTGSPQQAKNTNLTAHSKPVSQTNSQKLNIGQLEDEFFLELSPQDKMVPQASVPLGAGAQLELKI